MSARRYSSSGGRRTNARLRIGAGLSTDASALLSLTFTRVDATHVRVDFGTDVLVVPTLTWIGAYAFDQGLNVLAVVLGPITEAGDWDTVTYVTLTTNEQSPVLYTGTVFGLGDPATGTFTGFGVAPTVLSAVNVGLRRIHLLFSEAMRNNAALSTIGNYTLTPNGGATARTITAAYQLPGDPTRVVLEVNGDLSEGTLTVFYTVAGSVALLDQALNPLGSPSSAELRPFLGTGPFTIDSAGGRDLSFEIPAADGPYFIRLGDADGPLCYSGIPDQGYEVEIVDNAFECVSPELAPGTYDVRAEPIGGGAAVVLADALIVVPRWFPSETFILRQGQPNIMATGPRRLVEEPLQ